VQKQPANRKSGAASKAGSGRNSKAPAAAPDTAIPSGPATGQSKQDWRTAKVQKPASAVPIGKQLKVRTRDTCSHHHCVHASMFLRKSSPASKCAAQTSIAVIYITTGSSYDLLPAD